jgi:hypothetical protein
LFGVVVILFSTCTNSNVETINIEWVVLGDISGIGFFQRPIRLEFINDSGRTSSFRLRPERTTRIRLQKGMQLSGAEWPLFSEMLIYPFDLPKIYFCNSKTMEIFLFNPVYLEKGENSIVLPMHQRVLLYFYSFIEGSREYLIFSRSNIISLDIYTMERIDADIYSNANRIFEIMQENNLDIGYFYHDREGAFFLLELDDGNVIVLTGDRDSTRGFLVESSASKTGFILITNNGIWLED